MDTWDPGTYLSYSDERGRPFFDLVARVSAQRPGTVVDLGCGPGNLTLTLAERWPTARIQGIDSSEAMIRAARGTDRVHFAVGGIEEWATGTDRADVVVANASLQWVPGHLELLGALKERVAEGGWLAFQVPGNFDEPSHAIRRELAALPEYAAHVNGVAVPSSHDPRDYHRVLASDGWQVDAWETTYLHELTGVDPVFAWVSGTGARPTLQALPEELRGTFEAEFRRRLAEAYPADDRGVVLLPFRRVFVVAHRS